MKIVLATLNSKYIHSNLSLWCIKAGIDAFCSSVHDTSIIEATINGDTDTFCEDIIKLKPDILAFSCYIWNISYIFDICRRIKEELNCTIILGGPEVQYRRENILIEYSFIDFVISGEGEWSFSSFIEATENHLPYENCEGLTFRKNSKIYSVKENIHKETPPSPYCNEYFSCLNNRIAYIEASRGCPYRCAYCLSGQLNQLRYFSFDRICDDIIRLSHSGTKTIKFIDRTFNADSIKANKILKFILENYGKSINKNVRFHFEFSGDIISEETFRILECMPEGLCQLEIGIQSFNKQTLESINRKSDLLKLENNINRLMSMKNIHIHTDLIAGLPYEDLTSFRKSFNKAFGLQTNMLQLGFLKLLFGAEMREKSDIYPCCYNSEPPYEITSNQWLFSSDIVKLKTCEDALERLYNSGRFLITLDYLFNEVNLDPFETFCSFGQSCNFNGMSLSDFSLKVFEFFSEFCDKERLREKILCDLNCLPVNIHIPDELKVYDVNYKRLKKKYSEMLKKNIKISVLYTENKVHVVHTDKYDKITGRYFSEYYNLL